MKKVLVKMTAMCMIAVILSVTGCQGESAVNVSEEKSEVEIPMILTVNPSSGKKNEQALVDAFNEEYKGKYYLNAEWIMETEEEYRQNLKRQNVTDKLPAVITDLRMLPSFYQLMIKDGRIEDLSSYIENDSEWKDMIEPVVLKACTESDGSIYLAPLSTAAFSCSGIFWNESLFEQAGIKEFPKTWDEFFVCCSKLRQNGITPIGLHTEGTGWAAMLVATAEMADTPEGAEFMEQEYPSSYNNDSVYHMAETLQRLFRYTSDDAVNSDFDVAYNNFISGKTAMLANGYWMIDQIPKDLAGSIRFSPFPGNKLISSPETFGWAIVSGCSEEVKEGAVEFLKFRTRMNMEQREELFSKESSDMSQMLKDYINAYKNNPQIVPNYQVKWNSVLQEKVLGEALSSLALNKITTAEFVEMMNKSVEEYMREQ